MAAQQGRELLIAISDGGSPDTYTTIGGFTTNSISINETPVDITNKSSLGRFRETFRGDLKSVSTSGDFVFIQQTQLDTMFNDIFTTDTYRNYQITVPGFATFEGPFHVSNLTFTGANLDAVRGSCTFENAGHVTVALI